MAKKSAPKSFEDAIARLEAITQSMQNNAQPLEEALENYAEGMELVRYCQQKLAAVEQKIQVLNNDDLTDWELQGE
ncbi:exodeoxyribonuclease VII small subunit [Kingella oralis]|jgi:exodeoxyribonuclease VII, small subunit|uniref:exodeoxyribonuclease VII small subunit n=1 Tax=Kingella oralis TaxID=505 RepID=UPI0034E4E9CD